MREAIAEASAKSARAAAKTEAELSWAKGWSQPSKIRVCDRLGIRIRTLHRAGLTRVVDAEFDDSLKRQRVAILAEAKAMVADFREGRLTAKGLGFSELERRLGCKRTLLVANALTPGHRFHEARQECLELWGKASKKVAPLKEVQQAQTAPQQRFCLCCNTSVVGKTTINGFLPECWAEYQQWVAKDERLSA